MCLIIASTGPKPSEEVLRDGARKNSDGNGFAWLHRGQVQWRKGISTDEIVKMVDRATGPFIVHFRIGTHGPKIPELCHPFPITAASIPSRSGRAPRVLFHNGVYGQWESELKNTLIANRAKCPPPPWSDSRGLAVMVYYLGVDFLRLCPGSRFAVFDGTQPEGKQITMIGDWAEAPDKCWYSNRWCSAFPNTYVAGGYGSTGGGAGANFPQSRCGTDAGGTGTASTKTSGTAQLETRGGGNVDKTTQAAALAALDTRRVWEGFTAEGLQAQLAME